MKVKRKVLPAMKMVHHTIEFGGKEPAVLVLTTDGLTKRTTGAYFGPPNGAGWVTAQRLNKQGIQVQTDTEPLPF